MFNVDKKRDSIDLTGGTKLYSRKMNLSLGFVHANIIFIDFNVQKAVKQIFVVYNLNLPVC